MDDPVTVAASPSRPPREFAPHDGHPADNPIEAPGPEGEGSGIGADTVRTGTGASSLDGIWTFTGGGKASGGGGSGTGCGGPGGGQAGGNAYVAAQFAYIRGLILKNLVYPSEAKRVGLRGRVTVDFIILEDGLARNIRIVESSGHDVLDRTVLEAIRRLPAFPQAARQGGADDPHCLQAEVIEQEES